MQTGVRMTFSLLARDSETGKLGGVAATGNLCVGGWVLRGSPTAGLSASQGQCPSTLWGENVIQLMEQGRDPAAAVAKTVNADAGRECRQLAALDIHGNTATFTGADNGDFKGHATGEQCVASGNLLAGGKVLDAMIAAFFDKAGVFEDRLLAALAAGEKAGGDERGVQSTAMLVISTDMPPLSLRIDSHEAPISALGHLLQQTRTAAYREWLETVPTLDNPENCQSAVPADRTKAATALE